MKPGIVATYVSAASFSVAGDLTADFVAGVRVLADCGVDGTPLGVVTAASHADGATTVTVAPDSGSLTANLAHVWHSNDTPESLCHHGHSGPADGGDLAAYVKRDNSRPFTQGHITGQGPYTGFKFVETGEDVAADAGKWIVQVDGGQLTVFCVNDAETEFNAAVTVDRAGATPTAVTLAAPYLGLDGDVDVSGALYTDNLLGQDVSGGTVDALVSKAPQGGGG